MAQPPKHVQALTVRIPVDEYDLLRAEAFVRDISINEVVLAAVRGVTGGERRQHLVQMLDQARAARAERGRPVELPRNPHRRGRHQR